MNQTKTQAIVLRRTNFSEADRIVNFLTPSGKISGVARGVRRQKSKLAGGIEVFAINEIVFISGKSEMKTITSARMKEFFGEIVKDLDRTEFAYSAIKQISNACEHIESAEFFEILRTVFASLNDFEIPLELTRKWFEIRLSQAVGEEINLEIDSNGEILRPDCFYDFDFYDKVFVPVERGEFGANHIKFLRLMISSEPRILAKITGFSKILSEVSRIISSVSGK
ncbi:MAG: DNA repair protein RecO [Candidatus Nanogingivalis sp.]